MKTVKLTGNEERRTPNSGSKVRGTVLYVEIECHCGVRKFVCKSDYKRMKSCGCARRTGGKSLLEGERFGRWTSIGVKERRGGVWYEGVVCECGHFDYVNRYSIRNKTSTACKQCRAKVFNNRTHGMKNTPEYTAWLNMKARCTNPRSTSWEDYGGRGISVCDAWMSSFEKFFEHMGKRPDGLEIDRIDNDGNYEPGNCRWTTREVNLRNRKRKAS